MFFIFILYTSLLSNHFHLFLSVVILGDTGWNIKLSFFLTACFLVFSVLLWAIMISVYWKCLHWQGIWKISYIPTTSWLEEYYKLSMVTLVLWILITQQSKLGIVGNVEVDNLIRKLNHRMSSIRQSIELMYGLPFNLFCLLQAKWQIKIFREATLAYLGDVSFLF